MKELCVLGILLWLSAEDIKEQMLSMQVIWFLGVSGCFYSLGSGHVPVWQPGILLLLTGKVTQERIGYGDGWLTLALGMWHTLDELIFILAAGMILSVLYGVLFRKEEIPFVPFLTAGYVLELFIR